MLIRREIWSAPRPSIISLQIARLLNCKYSGPSFNGKTNEKLSAYINVIPIKIVDRDHKTEGPFKGQYLDYNPGEAC